TARSHRCRSLSGMPISWAHRSASSATRWMWSTRSGVTTAQSGRVGRSLGGVWRGSPTATVPLSSRPETEGRGWSLDESWISAGAGASADALSQNDVVDETGTPETRGECDDRVGIYLIDRGERGGLRDRNILEPHSRRHLQRT